MSFSDIEREREREREEREERGKKAMRELQEIEEMELEELRREREKRGEIKGDAINVIDLSDESDNEVNEVSERNVIDENDENDEDIEIYENNLINEIDETNESEDISTELQQHQDKTDPKEAFLQNKTFKNRVELRKYLKQEIDLSEYAITLLPTFAQSNTIGNRKDLIAQGKTKGLERKLFTELNRMTMHPSTYHTTSILLKKTLKNYASQMAYYVLFLAKENVTNIVVDGELMAKYVEERIQD